MKLQEGHEVDESWLMNELAIGVSKNRGYPKMDGENNGKPYF